MPNRRPSPTRLSGTPSRAAGAAVGKKGGGNATFLSVVNTLYRKVAAEVGAPKNRASWDRNDYERERKALKRKLTGIARSMAKLKLKLKTAIEEGGAAKADADRVRAEATAEVRVIRGEKSAMAAQIQTLQMQLQMATSQRGGGRAAAPTRPAPAPTKRRAPKLPSRMSPEMQRRSQQARIRKPAPDDYDDEEFGSQPIRSALFARVVIESHLNGRAVAIPLAGTGVYLLTETDVETLRDVGPENVGRAMQIAAGSALAGDDSTAHWSENIE
jgi:hypothetical protein